MILQTDEWLNRHEFQYGKGGCALFTMAHFSIVEGKYTFDRESFLKDCRNLHSAGILWRDCTIRNWDRLAQNIGLPFRIVIENGTHILPPDRPLKEDEVQLLYLYNPQTNLHHFVEGDRNDCIGFDPLGFSVTSEAYRLGHGYIESKRILRRISK